MKIKFNAKLINNILFSILIINIITISKVEARDNYAYIAVSDDIGSTYAEQDKNTTSSLYSLLKYNVGTNVDPSKTVLWENLYADVQFFSTHGDWDRIIFHNTGIKVGSGGQWYGIDHIGTDEVHWDADTILVTYSACKTAQNLDSGLSYKTAERGADVVVGFRNEIYSADAVLWNKYYNTALATGYRCI